MNESFCMSNVVPTHEELLKEIERLRRLLSEKTENEENFKMMVQYTPEPFFCINSDETYRFVNNCFASTLGMKPEDIIGKRLYDIFPFDEAEKRLKIIRNVFKTGESEEIEVKIVKPNGEEVYYVTVVTPIKDNNNNILWVSCISKNITEQKIKAEASEEKLKLNEEKWKLIIKNSSDALNLINEKGEQFFISEAAEKMTGFKNEEMLGPFSEKIHPDDLEEVQKAFYELLTNSNKTVRAQYRHIHKEKEWVWFEAVGQNFIDNPAINAIVVNVRDISLIKQKEQELIVAKEKAEESDQLKNSFLNNISHEIRTPLNAIMGFSKLIASYESKNENLSVYSDYITDNSNKLLDIITSVIDVSQLYSDQLEVKHVSFDIIEAINNIIEEFQPQIDENELDFSLNINPNFTILHIISDKTKICKIIKHLLDNAIKFTHKGSIQIDIDFFDDRFEFKIKDTGIGISKDMQRIIFDPFRQAKEGLNRSYGGNGVGLAIAKGFVHMLNGTIDLQSEPNTGTSFQITIPYQKSDENSPMLNPAEPVKRKANTLLIVEDEEINYLYLEEVMKDIFTNILYAKNGQEAIDICRNQNQIDLVLMDIKMPVMDGYTATKLVKALRPDLPVIAQTAYASEKDREMFLESGFDEYICKPIRYNELMNVVDKYIYR